MEHDFKKILSYEGACAAHYNYDPEKILPDVSNCPEHLRESTIADFKRKIIAEGINRKGYRPDYTSSEPKWFVWFWVDDLGSGFSESDYDYGYTGTRVGSRLVFETKEQAIHFKENFLEEHVSALLK